MSDIIRFFKDLFMMTDENKIGLSQFKAQKQPKRFVLKKSKEISLTDLMHGNV